MSSAKSLTWESIESGRSLMYSRKRARPRTDPCGTPHVTGTLSEEVPSRKTICDLLLRKASINFVGLEFMD